MGSRFKKIALSVLFILYIGIVLRLTVFRFQTYYETRQLNLTLGVALITVYNDEGFWPFMRLFAGNIGWFVPFGFLLPLLWKRGKFWMIVLSGFLFSLAIETAQYIFRKGWAELDDLILNTLGVVVGYLFYVVWRRWREKRAE
ncbi:MAG: VanZ family protein [Clostridiales bacterium]|nr:VanZ family protein [Clostridiales bacterium]